MVVYTNLSYTDKKREKRRRWKLRFLFLFKHNIDRITEVFYWPVIDISIWGFTSLYFQSHLKNTPFVVLMFISSIALWILVYRSQYEIPISLLEDLWNKNLVNVFVSPIKFREWASALVILGIIKSVMSFSFAVLIAFLLYKIKIYSLGLYLVPFVLLLVFTGFWIGCFIAGIILRYGTRVQSFAWTLVMVLAPFSAVYYPKSILPIWAQRISDFIPTSYIFEGMREVIYKGHLNWHGILISFLLNSAYLMFALIYFRRSFDKVLEKGLVKIY